MESAVKYEHLEEDSSVAWMDEQPMLPKHDGQRRLRGRLHRSATYLHFYYVASTLSIIIFLASILIQNHAENKRCPDSKPFRGKFGRHAQYMSVDHHYDHLWEDLEGESAVFNLTDPTEQGEELPASLAMFHQLHCLSSFRHAIQQAREGIDPGVNWKDNAHWPHCFDYMRKTIICWADDMVERQPHFHNGTRAPFIDGSDDVRSCGDSAKLIQMMKDAGKIVKTEPFP